MHVKPPLALLIDGDQVPAETIGPLLDRLEKQWTVDERVCVRNWRSTKDQQGWRAVAHELGIRLVQRDPVTTGKNAADIELAVITVDLLHDRPDVAFCLVTGDTDFTPVIERIRRAGRPVEVVGPKTLKSRRPVRPAKKAAAKATKAAEEPAAAKTPRRRRARKPARPAASEAPAKEPPTQQQNRFARLVRKGIDELMKEGTHERGWVSVNRLGSILARDGHKREDHGFAKSRPMRQVLGDLGFEVMQIETGAYRVRL